MATTPDVVIVGAGVMGCGTAYWLTQAGYHVLILEQESVAHGASGMASAMLESVGHGTHVRLDDPLTELAEASFAQHQIWGRLLPEETGIDTGYREHVVIHPVFTESEWETRKPQADRLRRCSPRVEWLDGQDLREVEPRLNPEALGGIVMPQAQVLAERYVSALARAAQQRGMVLRRDEVTGLERQSGRVTGVRLRQGETLPARTVVLALGPWSQHVSDWLGLTIPIYPVRGQLVKLRVSDPQLRATLVYEGMYVVYKADGMTLAGTTEEHNSGFDAQPTLEARATILDAACWLAPSLGQAEVVGQVAGLRPATSDGLPLIGPVPEWCGVYMIAGHFRSGMLLSPMSSRIIADLIVHGQSPLAMDAFDPGRFTRSGV